MRIEKNFSLRSYNTFDVDVKCKYFVESEKEAEFIDFIREYELKPEEIILLGRGSNFLFTEDFDGTVLYPFMQGIEILSENAEKTSVRAGAGVNWDDFVAWTVAHNLWGVENLSLIPGHVGAAPVQNVGAYGTEAGDCITIVEAIDIEKGIKVQIPATDCRFGYRDSIFKKEWKNKFLITYVVFELSKQARPKLEYGSIKEELKRLGDRYSLQNIRQAVINIRNSKLPDVCDLPNAGSFFKNPVIASSLALQLKSQYPDMPLYTVNESYSKLAAGWLIEQTGWKGKNLGKAGVYEKQALVLVNRGNATGLDIVRLANEIKKSVFMKFNVWIEPEVNII
ncbi:UDP-N-acetylmuramate dehydrogenase [Odoribacter laneus]|uniref:UDP-N-acetylmuramate dehydrogenase n=1 Tax=Odoribacter laneus TaxID=626933 RepID=UPI003FED9FC6